MKKSALFLSLAMLALASLLRADEATDTKPVPVRTPPPSYTAELRQAKVEGVVVVQVTIDSAGGVSEAAIAKSTDGRLDRLALEGVRRWKFKPATHEGQPVVAKVNIPLHFQLED